MKIIAGKQLIGAIRIAPRADSIGVPLFGIPMANAAYVSETDGDFRITEFLSFFNDEGYIIDRDLPDRVKYKLYQIGEPAPLVFWIDRQCHVVSGDAEAADIGRDYGDHVYDHEVLRDVRQLLADARDGVFRRQMQEWESRDITDAFADIFHKTPVHSRYWITRLGEAVRHARSLTKPPHPVDDELRRVTIDWIERFATKTDYDRLMAVMGNLMDGAISHDRAQAMVFAFLINKLYVGKFSEIERKIKRDGRFRRLFPEGIYNYWWRHNWPILPFKYQKPHDILEPLLTEIRVGRANKNFHRAERMSYLYFRREKAPNEIQDVIAPIINRYMNKLNVAVYVLDRDKYYADRYQDRDDEEACDVLYYYYMLMSLDGIIDGTHRLSRAIIEGRFGLSTNYVKHLAEIADMQLKC